MLKLQIFREGHEKISPSSTYNVKKSGRWAKFLWPSQNIGPLFMEHQWTKSVLQRYPVGATPAIQTVDLTLARPPYLIITALSSILLYLLIARCHITKPRTFQCFSSTTIISLFVVYGVIEPSYQLFLPVYRLNDGTSFGNKLILNSMRHMYPYTKSCILLCIKKKMRMICKGGFYINRKCLNRPTFIKTWFSIFKNVN